MDAQTRDEGGSRAEADQAGFARWRRHGAFAGGDRPAAGGLSPWKCYDSVSAATAWAPTSIFQCPPAP